MSASVSVCRMVQLTCWCTLALLAACSDSRPAAFQGYVEGEFVNVAAPIGGRLEKLAVRRGDQIALKTPLYTLEAVSQAAAEREAQEQLRAAEARLADLKLGRRPAEQTEHHQRTARAGHRRRAAHGHAART